LDAHFMAGSDGVACCGNEIAQRHGDAGWRGHNAPDYF
jgi:hypothetical protein